MKTETFGVIDAPEAMVLREGETIEWIVTYSDESHFTKRNTFLIHANTSDKASEGVKEMFPGCRILKVEYYGTYQY
jgi:hypothetical protein